MIVISAHTRPHVTLPSLGECWCKPYACGECGVVHHRDVDAQPDYTQPHMAVFSEQIPNDRVTLGGAT